MMVIKLASALTLKVLGVCKDVGLVTFGVLLLGEERRGPAGWGVRHRTLRLCSVQLHQGVHPSSSCA